MRNVTRLQQKLGMMLYNETTGRFEGYDGHWGGFGNVEIVGNIEVGRTASGLQVASSIPFNTSLFR